PARLPGEIFGRLAQDVAFFLEVADPFAQRGVLVLRRGRGRTGRGGGDLWSGALRVVEPDPVPQRLVVDAEVLGDRFDRRAGAGPVERDRLGPELRRVVLH